MQQGTVYSPPFIELLSVLSVDLHSITYGFLPPRVLPFLFLLYQDCARTVRGAWMAGWPVDPPGVRIWALKKHSRRSIGHPIFIGIYIIIYNSYRFRVPHQVCLPGSRSKTVRAMRCETYDKLSLPFSACDGFNHGLFVGAGWHCCVCACLYEPEP